MSAWLRSQVRGENADPRKEDAARCFELSGIARVLGELVRAIDTTTLGYWASTNEVCLKAGIPARRSAMQSSTTRDPRIRADRHLRRAGFVSWGAKTSWRRPCWSPITRRIWQRGLETDSRL